MNELDRRILRLALPALGGLAIEPLYVLVDTAIVGRLGTVPLGGLALASTVLTSLMWVFNFLVYGTTPRVAFLTGARRERDAAAVAAQGLWLCAVIGVPLALVVAFGGHDLARLLGGGRSDGVVEAASTYLRISAAGIPFVLVALVGTGYLRGRSDTATPLKVVLVANVVNVVLEVVLVYGLHLGVAGSAWGTVVAQALAAAWFLGLTGRAVRATGASLRPVGTEMRRLAVVGRHLFVRTGALLATLGLATAVAARVGPATLAGHQIAWQVENFLALSIDALAIAGQALIGTALGAATPADATVVARRLLRLGLRVGVVFAGAIVVLSPVLPHAFSGDGAVVDRARVALLVAAVTQLPGSVAWVLDGVLMGAEDFRFLQWANLAAGAAFVPFALAVRARPSLGIAGLWAGLLTWFVVRAAANAVRFSRGRWSEVSATA